MAGPDAGDSKRHLHGAGAGVEGPHGATSEVAGKGGLKGLDLRPGGEPPGAQDLGHARYRFLIDRRTGKRQIGGRSFGRVESGSGHAKLSTKVDCREDKSPASG